MKRILIAMISVLVLTALIAGVSPVMAAPANDQGIDAPEISIIILVHYPHKVSHVYTSGGVGLNEYQYSGIKWEDPAIDYYVNLSRQDVAFLDGITNAFDTWNAVATLFQATYSGSTKSSPLTLQAKWNRRLGTFVGAKNVVGWKNLRQYPDAIGVTYFWVYEASPGELRLIEVDTALNSNFLFRWWQNPAGESWTVGTSDAYDVDVQNIMTHEAGHWLVLDDLYDSADSDQTMYGYSDEFELTKRSLESGDIAGIQYIYPNP